MISEQDLLARFDVVRQIRDGEWMARCRAHDDHIPSVHVTRGQDRWQLYCHGCRVEFAELCASIGVEQRDMFAQDSRSGAPPIEAIYDYVDERGTLLYQVVRREGKRFSQRRPDGDGGWAFKLGDTRRVLYRLPRVLESAQAGGTVFVAEGEKDVHALERIGLVATCNPGGAGKWRPEYAASLKGARVVIVADKDDPGREHAAKVAESLLGARIVEAAEGKDAHDHVAAGHGVDDFWPVEAEPASGGGWEAPAVASVKTQRVEFLVPQRVPLGAVTLLAGDPGLGKSTLTTLWATGVSKRGGVALFASAEDGIANVVRPRLLAAGADVERIRYFEMRDEHGTRGMEIPGDMPSLSQAVATYEARLVVVDPLNAHISGAIDSHRDHGIRKALAPLARLADEHACAVVAVVHLNKDKTRDPLHRVGGSIGYVGAARSVLGFARDPNAEENAPRRLLVHLKSNWGALAPTRAYEIEPVLADSEDVPAGTTRLHFLEETDATASAVFGARDREERAADAEEAIGEQLAEGKRPSKDVKTAVMAELHVSARTVERAAGRMQSRGDLDISEGGFPRRTTWELVSRDTSSSDMSDTTRVATGRNGAAEPNSNGDTPQWRHGVVTEDVATGNVDLNAERADAERLGVMLWEGGR